MELLLHSHFIEGKRIGQEDILLEIAEQVGLQREAVAKVLASDDYKKEVEVDIQEGQQLGVR
ncbi:DsbA family oxidoreductase, partial [Bacillus paralicheniformis]|uniref:DsbA family oxidoreductase n=1 Tax=Bacillus paralicheniformis TaxID=1648923 RepID=UPI0020BE47C4